MLMYHGSYMTIEKPGIKYSRNNLDFGKGFYLAQSKEQAGKWAMRFKRKGLRSIVNVYDVHMPEIEKKYRVKSFAGYDGEWLRFVVKHRLGEQTEAYDVVSGGIADDRVFNTIELYLDRLINEEEALGRLRYEKPNWQMCILNQEILDHEVRFVESGEINYGSQ